MRGMAVPKLISICIPTYNRARYLEETLPSIIPQLAPDIEVLIYDTGSADGTAELVRRYQRSCPSIMYFWNDVNLGVDRTLLLLLEQSSGEYVWFFGSDDLMKEGAIETVRQRILGAPSKPTLVYLNHEIIDNQGKLLIASQVGCREDREFLDGRACVSWLGLNLGFISASIVRRDKALKVSSAEEFIGSLWVSLHLYLSCLLAGGAVRYVGRPMVRARRNLTMPYDYGEVFVTQANRVLWDAHRRGYSWFTTYSLIGKIILQHHVRTAVAWRSDKNEPLVNVFSLYFREYWSHPSFWLLLVPVRFLPRAVIRAIRNRLRAIRAIRIQQG